MLARALQSWPEPAILFAVFLAGAIVALPVILGLIAWQRGRALGQQIYEDGPSSHVVKQGTPTMGGLAFAASGAAGIVLFSADTWQEVPLLLLMLAAAAIGFADDYLKLVNQRPLGLRARTKFGLLFLVACAFVWFEIYTHQRFPPGFLGVQAWFGHSMAGSGLAVVPMGLWTVLAILAIVGSANAVNLTDGLDGLAAGSILPPLLLLSVVSPNALGFAVAGACAMFLFFNRHPARIFMGDTGSLALGTLLAGLAIERHTLLLLPLVGVVFVAEALSVILQVVSFKITGKRIFKMSPLHHHFEMIGWSETRVTATFIAVSLLASALVYLGLLPANPWLWPFARGSAL